MLEVKNLHVGYSRDVNILQGVSVKALSGRITALLGANGVGKSTLLKAIYGFLTPAAGDIQFCGKSLLGVPAHERIKRGISYLMQQPSIYRWMSVEENIQLGAWTFRNDKVRVQRKLEECFSMFPLLQDRKRAQARELSGGMQRMVELARALMTEPELILVDEPTAGLAVKAAQETYRTLRDLSVQHGLSLLLVDQDIRSALRIADYVYILELGRNRSEGPPEEFSDLQAAFWI